MTKIKDDEQPEKEKKISTRIIHSLFFSLLILVLFYIEENYFTKYPFNEGMPTWVLVIIYAAIYVTGALFFFFMSGRKKKPEQEPTRNKSRLPYFLEGVFVYIIAPAMFMVLILLGAVHGAFPADDTAFKTNVTNGLNLSMNVMNTAFTKIAFQMYSLGEEHPSFWIWTFLLWVTFGTVLLWIHSKPGDEEMWAQEFIEENWVEKTPGIIPRLIRKKWPRKEIDEKDLSPIKKYSIILKGGTK